jgi:hypothetical protein
MIEANSIEKINSLTKMDNDKDMIVKVEIPRKDWIMYTNSTDYCSTRRDVGSRTKRSLLLTFSKILTEKVQQLGAYIVS